MKLLLALLLTMFVIGLRSGSTRPDVRRAVPVFIGCAIVAVAYLSQRAI
jgi:hypothetical protein